MSADRSATTAPPAERAGERAARLHRARRSPSIRCSPSAQNISPVTTGSSASRRKTASRAEQPPLIAQSAAAIHHRADRRAGSGMAAARGREVDSLLRQSVQSFSFSERLGLRIPRLDSLLEESEPLELDSLAEIPLATGPPRSCLARRDSSSRYCRWCARAATCRRVRPANRVCANCATTRARFAEVVRQDVARNRDEPEQLQLTLGRFEVSARLDNLYDGRLRASSPNDSETEGPARRPGSIT